MGRGVRGFLGHYFCRANRWLIGGVCASWALAWIAWLLWPGDATSACVGVTTGLVLGCLGVVPPLLYLFNRSFYKGGYR
jgi:hypothetical protein